MHRRSNGRHQAHAQQDAHTAQQGQVEAEAAILPDRRMSITSVCQSFHAMELSSNKSGSRLNPNVKQPQQALSHVASSPLPRRRFKRVSGDALRVKVLRGYYRQLIKEAAKLARARKSITDCTLGDRPFPVLSANIAANIAHSRRYQQPVTA